MATPWSERDQLEDTMADAAARPDDPVLPMVSSGPVPDYFFRDPEEHSVPAAPDTPAPRARNGAQQRRRPRQLPSLERLRAQTRRVWSETSPHTTGTSMLSSKEVDLRHGRAVVDLAGRIAAVALAGGATAAAATAILLRVTQHFKLSVHVDVTMSSVIITNFRSLESDPITVLRTVQTETTDYRKLEAVEELVDNITRDQITLTDARIEIARITRMPRTYRRWVHTLAKGFMGFWIAALFGGNIWDCLVAGLTTSLVDLVIRGVAAIKAPTFFGQAAGAAVTGIVALLVMAARAAPGLEIMVSPSLIVAAGMISLLAGLSLTTAVRDAIEGYFVTAAARFVLVATLTGGIVLGLTLTLWVGLALGVPAYLSPSTGVLPVWWLQVIASALIAVSFAVINHLPPRSWGIAAAFGLLAWTISNAAGGQVGSVSAGAGAAALVVGILAEAVTRVARVPATALVTTGVVSLVPGMALYRGLLGMVQSSQGTSVETSPGMLLFQAVMVAVMLASGATLGAIIGRPLSLPRDFRARMALGKAWRRGREQDQV